MWLYIALGVSILFFFILYEIKTAPSGYEDESGFHKEVKK